MKLAEGESLVGMTIPENAEFRVCDTGTWCMSVIIIDRSPYVTRDNGTFEKGLEQFRFQITSSFFGPVKWKQVHMVW